MLVSLVAALALQAAPAPTGPMSSNLRPAQAIERIVADCMNKGRTVEEATATIVKCRLTDESLIAVAQLTASTSHINLPSAVTRRATYLATYNVAPRSSGSMATVSVSLEIPSSRGVLVNRSEGMTNDLSRSLASIL